MCTSYIHLNNSFLPLKETTVLITSTNKKFLISPLNSYMKNIQVDTYNNQYSFGKKKKKNFQKNKFQNASHVRFLPHLLFCYYRKYTKTKLCTFILDACNLFERTLLKPLKKKKIVPETVCNN